MRQQEPECFQRRHLIWCSRTLFRGIPATNHRLLEVALFEVDPLDLEWKVANHTPTLCNKDHIPDVPLVHEILFLLSSRSGQFRQHLTLGDAVPVTSWAPNGETLRFVTDIRSPNPWVHQTRTRLGHWLGCRSC